MKNSRFILRDDAFFFAQMLGGIFLPVYIFLSCKLEQLSHKFKWRQTTRNNLQQRPGRRIEIILHIVSACKWDTEVTLKLLQKSRSIHWRSMESYSTRFELLELCFLAFSRRSTFQVHANNFFMLCSAQFEILALRCCDWAWFICILRLCHGENGASERMLQSFEASPYSLVSSHVGWMWPTLMTSECSAQLVNRC